MKFSEWKRRAMLKLIQLASAASTEKERSDLTVLMDELTYLRYRDLAKFLRLLWAYCDYHKKYELCQELTKEEIEPSDE